MRRLLGVLFCIVGVQAPAHALEAAGKVLRETWYESRAAAGKLGCMHFLAREVVRDGRKLIRATLRDELSYLRSGDPYSDAQEEETLETPAGEVVELSYSVTLSKKQRLRLRGIVQGSELKLSVLDEQGQPTKFTQTIPWDRAALGLYAQDCFFEGKMLKPGDVHIMKSFAVYANRVLPITYIVKELDFTTLRTMSRQLLRVEASYPKDAYLTGTTLWLDRRCQVVKMEEEDSTLFGSMTRELTTQEVATAGFKPRVRDKEAPVLVNKPIHVRRGRPAELHVRVSLDGDDRPSTLFAEDGRQKVLQADNKAVELRLLAKAPVIPPVIQEIIFGGPPKVPAEYQESNFFIRSEDGLVQKLTKDALGDGSQDAEPGEKLRRIKRWVRRHVRGNYEIPFATADEVARSLEGDCSEMGMLAAAMARAAGIPSRVAFGLVYDAENSGFGGHLWAEAYVDGRWQSLDATGVTDSLNAAYIRIASYSMKDVLNPDELIAVRRAFTGAMKVEVIDAK